MTVTVNQGVQTKPSAATQAAESDGTVVIRVQQSTKDKIDRILGMANEKEFGRRVKTHDLISFALDLVNDTHIQSLRDASLTNADRLEMLFQQHKKKRKTLTKDQFIGLLISGKLETVN